MSRAPGAPGERPVSPLAAESFDRSARVYDDHVAFNRAGAARLIASIPAGRYPRLLDLACGTGFAGLAAIRRLGVEHVTGSDASAPMIDVFRGHLAGVPGVAADLQVCDVLDTVVEEGRADLALCTMALHWFTERAAAIALMTRALRPGGVLGILAPGPAHDAATVARIRATGDADLGLLADSIESNQIDPGALHGYLRAAAAEPIDIWTETRARVVPPEAYSARLEAVASHLWAHLEAGAQADVVVRLRALLRASADADGGYRYRFVKTFAVARAT